MEQEKQREVISFDLEQELEKYDNGELQQARIKLAQFERSGPTKEEQDAILAYEKFETVFACSNHMPITDLKDSQERERLREPVTKALARQESLKNDTMRQRNRCFDLENKLINSLKRATYLITIVKPKDDYDIGKFQSEIKRYKYINERDTNYLLNQIAEIDNLIIEFEQKLNEQPVKKPFKKIVTIDSVKIELEITKLHAQKQSLLNNYARHEEWLARNNAEIKEAERQIDIIENNYKDALMAVKAEIFSLSGITLEID